MRLHDRDAAGAAGREQQRERGEKRKDTSYDHRLDDTGLPSAFLVPLSTVRYAIVAAALLSLAGCGRTALDVSAPDASLRDVPVVPVDPPDAGEHDGGDGRHDAGDDAAAPDAGEPSCGWGPGVVGAWRVSDEIGRHVPALFHVDRDGLVRSRILWHETGGAFGMGIAVRDGVAGVAWRVTAEDGTNRIYFGRVAGGCLVDDPILVLAGATMQAFRGNVVATTNGWRVFWVADGGLWTRALSETGEPLADAHAIGPIDDARFSVAVNGERVGVLYVEGLNASVRMLELGPDGTVLAERTIADGAGPYLEPRLIALDGSTWGGAFLSRSEMCAFELAMETGALSVLRVGSACIACVSDPNYLLPAVATNGQGIGILWAESDASAIDLVFRVARPAFASLGARVLVTRSPEVRWSALGFDGDRFVAVYDDGDSGVAVAFLSSASAMRGIGARGLRGAQRLPGLVPVP